MERSGRKWRNSRRTERPISRRDTLVKRPEPIEVAMSLHLSGPLERIVVIVQFWPVVRFNIQ